MDSPLLIIDHATHKGTPSARTTPVLLVEPAPALAPAAVEPSPPAVDVKSVEMIPTVATKGADMSGEVDGKFRQWSSIGGEICGEFDVKFQQWAVEMERRAIESEEKHRLKNPGFSLASHEAASLEEKTNRAKYYRHVAEQMLKGSALIEFGFPGPLIDLSATPPTISWPHGRCLAEGRDLDAYPLAMKKFEKFDEKELELKWREWMCNVESRGEESDNTIDARTLFYHDTLAKMKQSQSMGPFPDGLPANYNAMRTWGEDVTLIHLERLYPRILAYGNLTVTVPEVFEGPHALDAKAYLTNAHAADVALKAMREFRAATRSSEKCDRLYQVMKKEFQTWAGA